MENALKEESRDIFYDYPILEFIGWIVVLYFSIFFVTFYVSPYLFNTRPYRPYPWHRRRRSAANPSADDVGLIETVSNSIENAIYK